MTTKKRYYPGDPGHVHDHKFGMFAETQDASSDDSQEADGSTEKPVTKDSQRKEREGTNARN